MKYPYPYPKHYMRWGAISGLVAALITIGIIHAVDAKAVCSPNPPDYPGCTVAQVESIAKNDTANWVEKRRFGQVDNVLTAAGLSGTLKDRVIDAFRQDVKQGLLDKRAAAQSVGKIDAASASEGDYFDSAGVWHTMWRGNSYTVDSFPYVDYVGKTFNAGYPNCYYSRSPGVYAYNYCKASNTPQEAAYWKSVASYLEQPRGQMMTFCEKEVLLATGAAGIGAFWTGPGVLAGLLAGMTGSAFICYGNQLGKASGWWN